PPEDIEGLTFAVVTWVSTLRRLSIATYGWLARLDPVLLPAGRGRGCPLATLYKSPGGWSNAYSTARSENGASMRGQHGAPFDGAVNSATRSSGSSSAGAAISSESS